MRLVQEIEEVVCVDETNSGRIIGEHGSDNMVLTGVAIAPTGRATRIPTLNVGEFDEDGARKRFSTPELFTQFPIAPNSTVPHRYQVLFVLAETDPGGGTGTFANKLVEDANVAAKNAEKADGGATAVLAEVAKEVAKELLKAAVKHLKENAQDDIFPAQLQGAVLTAPGFLFPNGKTSSGPLRATFNGHGGRYTVQFRWRVVP